jgi:phytoene dehydrogenase-like protein
MQRFELSQSDKDFVVYTILEATILNFRAYAKLSTQEMRRQFDDAKQRIEGLKQELGEAYLDSMKERIESVWKARLQMMTENSRSAFQTTDLNCVSAD